MLLRENLKKESNWAKIAALEAVLAKMTEKNRKVCRLQRGRGGRGLAGSVVERKKNV